MSPDDLVAGRYTLVRPLGRGGSGEVWQARDAVLDRDVAVKVVDVAAGEHGATRRFQQEARAAAGLSHPHVVAVYDAGTEGGHAYLVMELLPGPSLADLVRRSGPLDPDRAVGLASQAAAGLEAVHRAGAVHRDVKPGNLVLDEHGRVKLVDFGIARLAEATGTQLTTTGTVVGSAAYLSPEQARGDTATAASDHYALGCTLMTLLTGEPPFAAEHPVAVLRQHLDDAPPRVRDRRPDVPPWLDQAVDDLLAKDPVRRGAGLAALTGPRGGPAPATTKVLPVPADPSQVLSRPPTPRPAVPVPALAAAAVAVLALLLITFLVLRDDDSTGTAGDSPSESTPSPRSEGDGETTPPDGSQTSVATEAQPEDRTGAQPDGRAAAVAALRTAIADAAASGEIEEKPADELSRKVEDVAKAIDEARKADELDKALDELLKKLDRAASKGEVTSSAADTIRARVEDVRSAG